MRYDRGYGRDYGGWQGGGPMPRYDQMFRGRERHAGPPQSRRGRDAGRMGWRDVAPTAFGAGAHPSANQHVMPGETDFMGRPYSRAATDDRPWGLMDQEQRQARALGYDGDYGYDAGFRGRPRGYDRGMMQRDRGMMPGRGYDRGLGERLPYQFDGRPEDFHARNLPDSDEAGMDVHRYGHGRDMRYTSGWTRWF
jgi:hypothetical protein